MFTVGVCPSPGTLGLGAGLPAPVKPPVTTAWGASLPVGPGLHDPCLPCVIPTGPSPMTGRRAAGTIAASEEARPEPVAARIRTHSAAWRPRGGMPQGQGQWQGQGQGVGPAAHVATGPPRSAGGSPGDGKSVLDPTRNTATSHVRARVRARVLWVGGAGTRGGAGPGALLRSCAGSVQRGFIMCGLVCGKMGGLRLDPPSPAHPCTFSSSRFKWCAGHALRA